MGRVFLGQVVADVGVATPFLTQLLAPQSPETTCLSFLLLVITAGPLPGSREPPPPSKLRAAFCSPLWLLTGLRAGVCAEHLHEEITTKCFYYSGPALGEEGSSPGEGAWPQASASLYLAPLLSVRAAPSPRQVTGLCFYGQQGASKVLNRGGTWIASV